MALNSSCARWLVEPTPNDATLVLPGLAFACAINSATDLIAIDGFTAKTSAPLDKTATGTRSRWRLNGNEGISVGSRIDRRLQGNVGAGSWPVLDNELLTEPLRQPLSHEACENVGRAARRKAHDPAHRPRWIGLR